MKRLITKRNFINWLKEQDPTRTFRRRGPESCPLASAIKEIHGKIAFVDDNSWGLGRDRDNYYIAPNWAANFVAWVDRQSGKITAEEALKVANKTKHPLDEFV